MSAGHNHHQHAPTSYNAAFAIGIGLVLAWGGALAGKLRPDARHTYGWVREAFCNGYAPLPPGGRELRKP